MGKRGLISFRTYASSACPNTPDMPLWGPAIQALESNSAGSDPVLVFERGCGRLNRSTKLKKGNESTPAGADLPFRSIFFFAAVV
jgi:hypothetical protein